MADGSMHFDLWGGENGHASSLPVSEQSGRPLGWRLSRIEQTWKAGFK